MATRGRKRLFTEEQEDKALEMRRAGATVAQVVDRFGASAATIHRVLSRAKHRADVKASAAAGVDEARP